MKNTKSTKYYSDKQEKEVAKKLSGYKNPGSGAGNFIKGDVTVKQASLLVECKTMTSHKESISIKKEWFEKLKKEAFSQRLQNKALVFNFGPGEENYYIIDQMLMNYLIEKLEEDLGE